MSCKYYVYHQNQDSNMIQILKKRLESAMQSEVELQQQLQQQRTRVAQLERQMLANDASGEDPVRAQLQHEVRKPSPGLRNVGDSSPARNRSIFSRAVFSFAS